MRVSLLQASAYCLPAALSINPLWSPESDCELLWEAPGVCFIAGYWHIFYYVSSSNNTLASCKSAVSNPSVNQP